MKNLLALIILVLFYSCNDSSISDLKQETLLPVHKSELPFEIKSAAISKLSNSIASFQNNSSVVTIWKGNLQDFLQVGGKGRGPGEIGKVAEIVSSSDGYLILDTQNKTLSKFNYEGDHIASVFYEEMIMSISVDNLDNLYFSVVNFDRVSIKKSTFKSFNNSETIFSMPIKDLSESANKLNVQGQHLLINRFLTNQTINVDLNTLEAKIIINEFLPDDAEYKSNGPYKLPIRPVWRTNSIIGSLIFQLRNISNNKSEIYRSDLDGNIDALFTFNHYTTSFFEVGDEVWMFSPDSLFKYPKSSFLK